jgi:hypothetical protein
MLVDLNRSFLREGDEGKVSEYRWLFVAGEKDMCKRKDCY